MFHKLTLNIVENIANTFFFFGGGEGWLVNVGWYKYFLEAFSNDVGIAKEGSSLE